MRALIEQGLHAGVFDRAEKEMVEGVLALDQRPVTSIMTPRPKIVFLNADDPEEVNWRKIVPDEFGAVRGLVTLIDVMEAIVGDIPERGRHEQPEAKRREDGSWLVDATLPTGDLKTLLGLDVLLPNESAADFQTLGGFVVTQLGRIPAAGDHFEWGGWRFEVVDMDRRRVDKVLVAKAAPPAPAAGQVPA